LETTLYIGPAGWSYGDWNGIVYPQKKPTRFDPLSYLSSYFNVIEVNSTFYRVPKASACASWAQRISHRSDFQFTLKAFREFTHGKTPPSEQEVNAFKNAIAPLHSEKRLSTILIQFPWSFRFSLQTARYIATLVKWYAPYPTSVEVRHGSWASPPAITFFKDNDITMCGIDQPQIGSSLPAESYNVATTGAYFRLHGQNKREWFRRDTNRDLRYDYLYSSGELERWVGRIQHLYGKVSRIHVVLNNHFRGQAVANALQLKAMLCGERSAAPQGILDAYPHLSALLESDTRPDETSGDPTRQGSLFENQDGQ